MDQRHLDRINKLGRSGYWSLILWIPLAFIGAMAFDHPRSAERLWPWLYLAFLLALPIMVLTAPFFARHHLSWGRTRIAYATVLIPQGLLVLPLIVSLLSMIYFAF